MELVAKTILPHIFISTLFHGPDYEIPSKSRSQPPSVDFECSDLFFLGKDPLNKRTDGIEHGLRFQGNDGMHCRGFVAQLGELWSKPLLSRVVLIWLHCRIGEFFDFSVVPSISKGHGLLDGALAMSARRHKRHWFSFLIKAGANPHICDGLPLQEAAASGDAELVRLLLTMKPVPYLGKMNAHHWAEHFGHGDLAREIAAIHANDERNQLQASVANGREDRIRMAVRL